MQNERDVALNVSPHTEAGMLAGPTDGRVGPRPQPSIPYKGEYGAHV